MDEDLDTMSRDELVREVIKLRGAVREHRDSTGHDLCWHHPDLWATLPEDVDPAIAVPPWPAFLRGCVAYRQSLDRQAPDAAVHAAEYDDPAGAQRTDRMRVTNTEPSTHRAKPTT